MPHASIMRSYSQILYVLKDDSNKVQRKMNSDRPRRVVELGGENADVLLFHQLG